MKADVTFHVEYDENENHLRISCGNVDGDGLPMPLYMMMLTSLIELQYKINSEKPTNIDDHLSVEERIRKWDEENLPPTPKTVVTTNKMRKAYTEEEKNEIAQLYQDGLQVNEIARRFGRKPESIYKLVSSMGVKRRQLQKYEKPEVIAASDASDQPKAKRECTLKKPWYLQRQTPNNRDKAKHE